VGAALSEIGKHKKKREIDDPYIMPVDMRGGLHPSGQGRMTAGGRKIIGVSRQQKKRRQGPIPSRRRVPTSRHVEPEGEPAGKRKGRGGRLA